MKKHTKLLSLLMAGLLICGVLTACGGKDSDGKGNGNGFFTQDDDRENNEKPGNNHAETTAPDKPGVPDHDHSWSDWETTAEPTCSKEGTSTRTCSCGATETNPISKIDHSEGEWVVVSKPTATTDGKKELRCSVCGEKMDEEVFTLSAEWTYETDSLGYCNGYAHVNGSSRDVILDANGDVVYATADGEEIEIYGNGYFISSLDGVQYLKKADGTVVCSTESLEITGFGLTENYEEYTRFLCDGYVFAYDVKEAYNGTTYRIGILGTDGKWIAPLSEDHPIITSGAKYSTAIFNKFSYEYAGDGILFVDAQISGYSYDFLLYDIEANEIHRLNPTDYASNLDYVVTVATFKDGVAYSVYSNRLYVIRSDGSVTVQNNVAKSGLGILTDDAGNYYSIYNNAIYRNGALHEELDFNVTGAECVDGVWLIFIKNTSGAYFYTYMTKDGDFLFEPVSTTATYICHESGVGVSYTSGTVQSDGIKLVINMDGDVLYTSQNAKADIYINNGVVCEEVKGAFSSTETYTFLK